VKPFLLVVLATLIGCSASTIPDAMVKEQVKSCLETKRVGNTTFSERFTIRDVTVKDRVVADGEAKVVVAVRMLLNQGFNADLNEDHAWSAWVGRMPGKKGEMVSNGNLEVRFKEIDSGWQIQCEQ
jgi:hypothetical protein